MWLSGNIWLQLPAGIKGFPSPCCGPHACPWLRIHRHVGRQKDLGDTHWREVPTPPSTAQWTLW